MDHPSIFFIRAALSRSTKLVGTDLDDIPGTFYPSTRSTSHYDKRECPDCGMPVYFPRPFPPLEIEEGRVWPDFVHSSVITRPWYVSDRVATFLTSRKLSGVSFREIGDVVSHSPHLKSQDAPRYYEVIVENKLPADISPDFDPRTQCPICFKARGYIQSNKPRLPPRPLFEIFKPGTLYTPGMFAQNQVYCDFQFVEYAREQRWTGVVFGASVPVATELGYRCSKPIDIFDPQWPPTEYYE